MKAYEVKVTILTEANDRHTLLPMYVTADNQCRAIVSALTQNPISGRIVTVSVREDDHT